MSQATLSIPGTTTGNASQPLPSVVGILIIAATLATAGSLLATTMSDRTGDTAQPQRLAPAPSALPVAATAGSTTVPDADTVFRGREVAIEDPAPTF